jgi:hypothetical protein
VRGCDHRSEDDPGSVKDARCPHCPLKSEISSRSAAGRGWSTIVPEFPDTNALSKTCRWCGRAFIERRGGSPQVFCRSGCRTAFHTAGRRWAERAVAAGVLTVAELRDIPAEACTLDRREERPLGLPRDIGSPDTALSSAPCARRRAIPLGIAILADAVPRLCELGWLDTGQSGRPSAIADAVTDLSDRALELGLRPRR